MRLVTNAALKDTELVQLKVTGAMTELPGEPGVYAVYNAAGELQYVGLSRKVSASINNHLQELPELTAAVKYEIISSGARDELTGAWKSWVEEAVGDAGVVPPGNVAGETKWQARSVRVKPEIKLTAGKEISVPLEELIGQVVKGNKVVAFIKGTRSAPQCGFSYKMLQVLNESRTEYEVLNVLDDFHNPGLRDAIKAYSQWPTIPQLYVNGEFVGGSDIVEQMASSGELKEVLQAK